MTLEETADARSVVAAVPRLFGDLEALEALMDTLHHLCGRAGPRLPMWLCCLGMPVGKRREQLYAEGERVIRVQVGPFVGIS